MFVMERCRKVTAGTAAQAVDVNCANFLMVNTSENATVYFKDEYADGKPVTAENGFALLPGQMTPVPMTAYKLSVMATAENTDIRLLLGKELF